MNAAGSLSGLDDLSCFVAVVRHNGYSSAARASGIDKTRLSRRVAALELRLGVTLLQRDTRGVALTEVGKLFYADCLKVVEGAQLAYQGVAILRSEPAGTVRLACSQALAASYLTPVLPGYLAAHPKVRVELELGDASLDAGSQCFDVALRSSPQGGSRPGLVARPLGAAPRMLLASRAFLDRHGRPATPDALSRLDAVAPPGEVRGGLVHWRLLGPHGRKAMAALAPRLQTADPHMQLAAVAQGLGAACLPLAALAGAPAAASLERLLPAWSVPDEVVYALYPGPRGMLPSVRSLIDYLAEHFPAGEHGLGRDRSCAFAL